MKPLPFQRLLAVSALALFSFAACSAGKAPKRKGVFAIVETTRGVLVLELFPKAAPKTVANFRKLVRRGFYERVVFHRVIPNFMAQTGDPTGTGRGGPGYRFADEINARALGLDKLPLNKSPQRGSLMRKLQMLIFKRLGIKSQAQLDSRRAEVVRELRKFDRKSVMEVLSQIGYKFNDGLPSRRAVKGAVAMANAGPNTNGSQFFINQVDTPHLNGMHTVFGQLVGSQDVLNKIIAGGNGKTRIKSVRIVENK